MFLQPQSLALSSLLRVSVALPRVRSRHAACQMGQIRLSSNVEQVVGKVTESTLSLLLDAIAILQY